MSNGFGAAFGGLLLAVLSGMALFLAACLAGFFLLESQSDNPPNVLRILSGALSVSVTVVAGFAVIALIDESAILATVFLGLVLVPIGAVGLILHRVTGLSSLDIIGTTGVAWSIPYLIGLTATFVFLIGVNRAFVLAPAASRSLGIYWIATLLGALIVLLGTFRIAIHIGGSVFNVEAT